MDNKSIFIREFQIPNEDNEDVKKMITVVPSMAWLLLVGGIIIITVFILWSLFGHVTVTEQSTGFYHPEATEDGEVLLFLPLTVGKKIETGMNVTLYPSGLDRQDLGYMHGTISFVDSYVTTYDNAATVLGSPLVAQSFYSGGPMLMATIKLDKDTASKNGYAWSNERGREYNLKDGTYMLATIEIKTASPIEIAIPDLAESVK